LGVHGLREVVEEMKEGEEGRKPHRETIGGGGSLRVWPLGAEMTTTRYRRRRGTDDEGVNVRGEANDGKFDYIISSCPRFSLYRHASWSTPELASQQLYQLALSS